MRIVLSRQNTPRHALGYDGFAFMGAERPPRYPILLSV